MSAKPRAVQQKGGNWAGKRCGSFNLHCMFAEENSRSIAPHSTTSVVRFRNLLCGCPGEPTCILRPPRMHTNHAADEPCLITSLRPVTVRSTETVTAMCPRPLLDREPHLRMDRSPSKRVFTENTLNSQSVVDTSTRNDGYGAYSGKNQNH